MPEEKLRNNQEEALWRERQGRQDRGGGNHTDGSKRTGGRQIAVTGLRAGVRMTPGRYGAV